MPVVRHQEKYVRPPALIAGVELDRLQKFPRQGGISEWHGVVFAAANADMEARSLWHPRRDVVFQTIWEVAHRPKHYRWLIHSSNRAAYGNA